MSSTTTLSPSLYERLGGPSAVKAAVDEFYRRLLDDDRLAHFFDETKLVHLKLHQVEFFKLAFTKIPDDVNVPEMLIEKHKRLFQEKGLNETHFDLVAGHFVATLEHLQVSQELIDEAVAIVVPLRTAFAEGSERFPVVEEKKDDDDADTDVVVPTDAGMQKEERASTATSLADKLGGVPAVKAAVQGMYSRILDDEDLIPFFENINITKLKLHQIEFMKVAFTQIPDDLDVPAMILEKHSKLFNDGLNETHFDKVAGHLVDTLNSLDVPQELIDEVVGVVGPLRPVFEQGALEAKERGYVKGTQ